MAEFSRWTVIWAAAVLLGGSITAIHQRWGHRMLEPLKFTFLFMSAFTLTYRIWVQMVTPLGVGVTWERDFILVMNNMLLTLWILLVGGLSLRAMWIYKKAGYPIEPGRSNNGR